MIKLSICSSLNLRNGIKQSCDYITMTTKTGDFYLVLIYMGYFKCDHIEQLIKLSSDYINHLKHFLTGSCALQTLVLKKVLRNSNVETIIQCIFTV